MSLLFVDPPPVACALDVEDFKTRRIDGNIRQTIPSLDEIEKGECGTALKILWSTALPEAEMQKRMETLGRLYGITEFVSNPATIFQYKGIVAQ